MSVCTQSLHLYNKNVCFLEHVSFRIHLTFFFFNRKPIISILDRIFNCERRLFQKFIIHSEPHKAGRDFFLNVNWSSDALEYGFL